MFEFSGAGRRDVRQSVRPNINDFERQGSNEEEDAWFDNYMKPFNPEEEERKEERKSEEEGKEERKSEAGSEKEEEAARQEEEAARQEEEASRQEEEAVRPKAPRVPSRPTQEEVDEHMLTHVPYRSWCPGEGWGTQEGKEG